MTERQDRWQTIEVKGVLVRCRWGDARWVRRVFALADDGGVIQAHDMLELSSEPTHHTTTLLEHVLSWRDASIQ